MRGCDQYYGLAVIALFFYDYVLTVVDEVSHVVDVTFHSIYHPSERQNLPGTGGNRGV